MVKHRTTHAHVRRDAEETARVDREFGLFDETAGAPTDCVDVKLHDLERVLGEKW
jgi:hypothetical protein